VGYREPGYPVATTGAVGARDSYPGTGVNTGTFDSAYPATGSTAVRDSGYRTPTTATGGVDNPEFMQPGEIPAREYINSSIHTNY
jgi:hypothetical protein